MRRILGGREKGCDYCGGTVVYLQVKYLGLVTQCRECKMIHKGRAKDEVKIYNYEENL